MTGTLNHVMCVDDENDILKITKFSLENIAQYKVTTCNGGREALANVIDADPDVILLDIMMPDLDGIATFKTLQQILTKKVPVIFMTAKVQPQEIDMYESMGAAGVIAKPFDPITLAEQIATYWRKFHTDDRTI